MSSQASILQALNLNFTKLSRGIATVLVVGFLAQLIARESRQYLALVAGRFIPCVWNVFTAGFLETSILQLVFSVVSILLLARIVEPIWGSKEFLKFISIVNLGTGFFTLAVLYVWYIITSFKERAGKVLYMEVSGFHGITAGLLVAVKQQIPDTEVTILKLIKFQAKALPSLYVASAAGVSVFLGCVMSVVPVILAGTFIAWSYLRYWQGKAGLNLRGDPSHEFRFATFFPELLQPFIDSISALCSKVLRLEAAESADGSSSFVMQGRPLPGSDSTESARRRERGARVLEERLTASEAKPFSEQSLSKPDLEAPAHTDSPVTKPQ